MIHDLVYSGY